MNSLQQMAAHILALPVSSLEHCMRSGGSAAPGELKPHECICAVTGQPYACDTNGLHSHENGGMCSSTVSPFAKVEEAIGQHGSVCR